jgi:hypothetical protein
MTSAPFKNSLGQPTDVQLKVRKSNFFQQMLAEFKQ